jgi:hypothetical protein
MVCRRAVPAVCRPPETALVLTCSELRSARRYEMPVWLDETNNYVNYVITVIFLCEVGPPFAVHSASHSCCACHSQSTAALQEMNKGPVTATMVDPCLTQSIPPKR